MNITVKYFAALAECAGKTQENLEIDHNSIAELYAHLQRCYGFAQPLTGIRAAVNTSYASLSQPLAEGDTVVFITPVAGG